jgi:hypothetical protein
MNAPHDAMLKRAEDGLAEHDEAWYELTLVVNGASELSTLSIANARRLCDTSIKSRYHLSVVDLRENPAGAVFDGPVIAAPTLVTNWPLPPQRFVRDLSQTDKAFLALGLPYGNDTPTPTD